MKRDEQHDRLMQVLDEWQPTPSVSADFEARLRERTLAAEAAEADKTPRWRGWGLQWVAMAAVVALIAGAGWFARRGNTPPPSTAVSAPAISPVREAAMTPVAPDPITQDLQVFMRDHDLIQNLDFLSAPDGSGTIENQE